VFYVYQVLEHLIGYRQEEYNGSHNLIHTTRLLQNLTTELEHSHPKLQKIIKDYKNVKHCLYLPLDWGAGSFLIVLFVVLLLELHDKSVCYHNIFRFPSFLIEASKQNHNFVFPKILFAALFFFSPLILLFLNMGYSHIFSYARSNKKTVNVISI